MGSGFFCVVCGMKGRRGETDLSEKWTDKTGAEIDLVSRGTDLVCRLTDSFNLRLINELQRLISAGERLIVVRYLAKCSYQLARN